MAGNKHSKWHSCTAATCTDGVGAAPVDPIAGQPGGGMAPGTEGPREDLLALQGQGLPSHVQGWGLSPAAPPGPPGLARVPCVPRGQAPGRRLTFFMAGSVGHLAPASPKGADRGEWSVAGASQRACKVPAQGRGRGLLGQSHHCPLCPWVLGAPGRTCRAVLQPHVPPAHCLGEGRPLCPVRVFKAGTWPRGCGVLSAGSSEQMSEQTVSD